MRGAAGPPGRTCWALARGPRTLGRREPTRRALKKRLLERAGGSPRHRERRMDSTQSAGPGTAPGAWAAMAPRLAVVLGRSADADRVCRVDEPGRVLRIWALLNDAGNEPHRVSLPPAAAPRLQRQLDAPRCRSTTPTAAAVTRTSASSDRRRPGTTPQTFILNGRWCDHPVPGPRSSGFIGGTGVERVVDAFATVGAGRSLVTHRAGLDNVTGRRDFRPWPEANRRGDAQVLEAQN